MAYNRENLLKRIVEIREIVLEQKKWDTPQTKIYEKFIKGKYHISYSTFNNYLTIAAPAQLKKIQTEKSQEKLDNPTLF
jgi:hypothetical protein